MIRIPLLIAAFAALTGLQTPAQAQGNPFAPRVIVNDRAISNFEVSQRVIMLQLFQTPGDIEKEAVKGLVEDRLRLSAAKSMGITVTPDQVRTGMEEFASRANLTADQFIEAIGQAGVSAQTFRDFVEAGLLWREVVRARFLPRTTISEAEVDRVLAQAEAPAATRVLVSELVLQAPPEREAEVMAFARRLQAQITSEADFSAAARNYSNAPTASAGGRLDWMPITNLPPAVAPVILGLKPGQTSAPISLGNAVGLFQLRGTEAAKGAAAPGTQVEYALFTLPAGAVAEAASVRARVDTCDDLYPIARGLPADRLIRETRPMSAVPADIGLALARLDDNETTDFARGGAQVVLMLCSRNPLAFELISRDAAREQVLNRRLASQADHYLEELRSDAIIREP